MKSDSDNVNVIIDADILSMFAKADAIDLLQDLLGRERVAMTPAIRDEVSAPLQYGDTFPQKILSSNAQPASKTYWSRRYRRHNSG